MADPIAGTLTLDDVWGPGKGAGTTATPPGAPAAGPQAAKPLDKPMTLDDAFGKAPPAWDWKGGLYNLYHSVRNAVTAGQQPGGEGDMQHLQASREYDPSKLTEGVRRYLGIAHDLSPVKLATGTAKAVTSMAVGTAEAVIQGVAGLTNAAYAMKLNMPLDMVGKAYRGASDAAGRSLEQLPMTLQSIDPSLPGGQVSQFTGNLISKVRGINLAPEGYEEKAAEQLVYAIPNGLAWLGDVSQAGTKKALKAVGVDEYHAAISGALVEAGINGLATLMMFKPERAAKIVKPVELVDKEGTPPVAKGLAEQINANLDAMAQATPEVVADLADHIGKADASLGKSLKQRVKFNNETQKWEPVNEVKVEPKAGEPSVADDLFKGLDEATQQKGEPTLDITAAEAAGARVVAAEMGEPAGYKDRPMGDVVDFNERHRQLNGPFTFHELVKAIETGVGPPKIFEHLEGMEARKAEKERRMTATPKEYWNRPRDYFDVKVGELAPGVSDHRFYVSGTKWDGRSRSYATFATRAEAEAAAPLIKAREQKKLRTEQEAYAAGKDYNPAPDYEVMPRPNNFREWQPYQDWRAEFEQKYPYPEKGAPLQDILQWRGRLERAEKKFRKGMTEEQRKAEFDFTNQFTYSVLRRDHRDRTELVHNVATREEAELLARQEREKDASGKVHAGRLEAEDYLYSRDFSDLEKNLGDIIFAEDLTVHKFLDEAVKGTDNPYLKSIMQKLRTLADDIDIHWADYKDDITLEKYKDKAAGIYRHFTDGSHQIIMNDTVAANAHPGSTTRTILHEIVHAVTTKFIDEKPNDPRVLKLGALYDMAKERNKAMRQVYDDYRVKYGDFDWKAQGRTTAFNWYGFTDLHEFVAEALSNPRFQLHLIELDRLEKYNVQPGMLERMHRSSHKYSPTNLLSAFAEIVKQIFGITGKKEGVLFNEIMVNSLDIANAQFLNYSNRMAGKLSGGIVKTMGEVHAMARAEGKSDPLKAAAAIGRQAALKTPGAAVAKGKLGAWFDWATRMVNPEGLGPKAKLAAALTAREIFFNAMADAQHWENSKVRRNFWAKMSEKDRTQFIDWFEKGAKFKDPKVQEMAEAYRNWNKEIFERERTLGFKYESVDNYLYHVYERPNDLIAHLQQRWGNKWKDPGFIKDRTFDLYKEARAAGFKPKFTNPEDIMLARQHAASIAEMQMNLLERLEENGLAVKGKGKDAPDWPAVQRRAPNGEQYWVHADAGQILYNAFDSHSLWSDKTPVGDVFRSAMAIKNTVVPLRLALSLFHPLHVQTIHNATGMVRATKLLFSGKMGALRWSAEMAKAGLHTDLISGPRTGYALLKAFRGELSADKLTADVRTSLQYMAEGGMIPELSAQYRTQAMKNFQDAKARLSPTLAWKAPLAALDAFQGVMFKTWIPSLKIASYLQDVQAALKADPTLLTDSQRRALALTRIRKSVDNRYGEMAYNTLFWNRTVKDLAVANTLSLGWNLGFLREYGGGALDAGQWAVKGSKWQAIKEGKLDRPMFVLFYTTQALLYGGLMTWAFTGNSPKTLSDYVNPQVGTNDDGTPKRVSTMFYPREFVAIAKHMQDDGVVGGLLHTLKNKASGVVGLSYMAIKGVDDFGREVRDPNGTLFQKLSQTLRAVWGEVEPIPIGQTGLSITGGNPKADLKDKSLGFLGFSPAPKYVTADPIEEQISTYYAKHFAAKQTPYEQATKSADARQLRGLREAGKDDEYDTLLQQMQEKYNLTPTEMKKLTSTVKSKITPSQRMFMQFPWQQQRRLLDKMTEDQRAEYLPRSNKEHLRNHYIPPEERNGTE